MAKKSDKPLIIQGIKLDLCKDDLNDFELVEALAQTSDPELDEDEHIMATVRLARLVYGDDWPRVKRDLREANGGKLPGEVVVEFIKKTFEGLGAKK